jgi:phytoene dehydrogenase-like protein
MTDAIVIGAGVNGLAAAAHLAMKGWKVQVFERAARPGGAAKTLELTLPGFRHDWGALNLSLFAGGGFHQMHGEALAKQGFALVPAQHCFATAFPDGRWIGVSSDLETTAARISGFSEKDAETWRQMVSQFAEDAPHIFSVLGTPMSYLKLSKTAFRIWRARDAAFLYGLGRLLLSSPRSFLDETFESDHLKAALAAWGMHLDFPPDQAGGALFPYLEAMANQSFGMVIGQGGADTMIDALTGLIRAHGGTIECGVEVTGISSAAGAATGVTLSDGRQIKAKKAVIANVTPKALVDGLLDGRSGRASYDAGARAFRHAPGTMMLHLAMDALPDWAAGAELKDFAYVHLAPSFRQMAQTYTDAMAGLLPAEPVLVVGQPSTIDPTRAPKGKHTLWVQVRMVPAEIAGDAKGEIDARDWETVKDAMAERVLDIIESYAPGTRKKILGRAVVSPLDLEADNPNLVGGDQVAGSHHLNQNFLYRPMAGWADWTTPLDRLFLVGASTWPGGGVGAGSGTMLAEKLAGRR